jgi:hypothetical protein
MPNQEHVLSFAVDKDGGQLFIHADAKGLQELMRSLEEILEKLNQDQCDHDHLMSPLWGGTDLSEHTIEKDVQLIHHVKICGWTKEWAQKHKLSEE